MNDPQFVGPQTFARRIGVSAETVREWIRRGKLPAMKTPSGYYRIPVKRLTEMLQQIKPQNSQTL